MLQKDKEVALKLGAIFLEENIFYIPNFFSKELLKKIKKEIDAEKKWEYYENGNTFDNNSSTFDSNNSTFDQG